MLNNILSLVQKILKTFALPITLGVLAIGLASFGLTVYLKMFSHVAHEQETPKEVVWSFDGIFGTVDRQSAQRGYQVYKEVCAGCHAMKRIPFRSLSQIGFSEAEIKSLAASFDIQDGPNDEGDMFDRPGRPSDYFVSPFANEKQARASNGGAYPPDLSLMIKARPNGANYVYSLLTGYGKEVPSDIVIGEGMNYNPYFPGKQIAMANPLSADLVEYSDGTQASIDQMSRDIVNFLQWAAEPEMEQRKQMGIKVLTYMFIFTFFFYIAKVITWARVKRGEEI